MKSQELISITLQKDTYYLLSSYSKERSLSLRSMTELLVQEAIKRNLYDDIIIESVNRRRACNAPITPILPLPLEYDIQCSNTEDIILASSPPVPASLVDDDLQDDQDDLHELAELEGIIDTYTDDTLATERREDIDDKIDNKNDGAETDLNNLLCDFD
jgi:hypothetical protein